MCLRSLMTPSTGKASRTWACFFDQTQGPRWLHLVLSSSCSLTSSWLARHAKKKLASTSRSPTSSVGQVRRAEEGWWGWRGAQWGTLGTVMRRWEYRLRSAGKFSGQTRPVRRNRRKHGTCRAIAQCVSSRWRPAPRRELGGRNLRTECQICLSLVDPGSHSIRRSASCSGKVEELVENSYHVSESAAAGDRQGTPDAGHERTDSSSIMFLVPGASYWQDPVAVLGSAKGCGAAATGGQLWSYQRPCLSASPIPCSEADTVSGL